MDPDLSESLRRANVEGRFSSLTAKGGPIEAFRVHEFRFKYNDFYARKKKAEAAWHVCRSPFQHIVALRLGEPETFLSPWKAQSRTWLRQSFHGPRGFYLEDSN